MLQELQKKKGLTVILSLHELELAARVSDRILCVDGAFVEQVGTPEEIFRYIKQRNPINHPCVMFKKSSVELSGGYQPCPYFEDYDLWVRMYRDHAVLANLPDTLLYMRVNGMHQRRGGIQYAKHIVEFRMKMYRYQVITFGEFLPMTVARVLVSLMPNGVRKYLYDKTLRKHK